MAASLTLYHATDNKGAEGIRKEQRFRPGRRGYAGAAIYFADNRDHAVRHAFNGNPDKADMIQFVITCKVHIGRCVEAERKAYDGERCRREGFDSVKIQRTSTYAVFDPSRIEIMECRSLSGLHVWYPPRTAAVLDAPNLHVRPLRAPNAAITHPGEVFYSHQASCYERQRRPASDLSKNVDNPGGGQWLTLLLCGLGALFWKCLCPR